MVSRRLLELDEKGCERGGDTFKSTEVKELEELENGRIERQSNSSDAEGEARGVALY